MNWSFHTYSPNGSRTTILKIQMLCNNFTRQSKTKLIVAALYTSLYCLEIFYTFVSQNLISENLRFVSFFRNGLFWYIVCQNTIAYLNKLTYYFKIYCREVSKTCSRANKIVSLTNLNKCFYNTKSEIDVTINNSIVRVLKALKKGELFTAECFPIFYIYISCT